MKTSLTILRLNDQAKMNSVTASGCHKVSCFVKYPLVYTRGYFQYICERIIEA